MKMTDPKPSTRSPGRTLCRYLRTAALLLLCTAAFDSSTLAAQSQPRSNENPANRDKRQAGPPQAVIDSSSFIIVDDPNRLGDLFERLDTPDFQIIRPSKDKAEKSLGTSPDTFVKSVSIRGKAIGSIADLTIVMEIQQSKAGTSWTPIGLEGHVLRSVRSGNSPVAASVPRPGGPWQVQTGSAGTHRIEIELGTEITSDRTTRRFALSIPEAASTELSIEVPEQVLFASTNARDSLQTRFDPSRNLYTIAGLLTPRSRLELRWLGQSLIRNEDRIRLECRGQIAVRMDLDAVSTRQVWQIRPLTGLPAALSFEIPPDESLIDIFLDGQATRPRFEKSGTGNTIVNLENPFIAKGPNSEPVSVELVTRLTYPAKSNEAQTSSREFTWRAPQWKHGEIVTGIVALEMPDRWVLSHDQGTGFEPVDLRDLSDRLRKSTNQAALRFSGTKSEYRFRIRRRQPPLFSDVRTIGIVRRSQIEYVSDIVFQGEIDPLKEYEIELDRSARPLFVGPRDVWERYEIVGETVSGDRKLRRLRLTPNRSLKPETTASLRIRYLRRADDPEMFSICLPRFVESTGETYRTWLLPEPSIEIEPIETAYRISRKLPPQDIAVFTNLLEQSIGDDDKWIKPRNAANSDSVFFRIANKSEKEIAFRTLVRPATLVCTQEMVLRPTRDAIGIRHIFECSIDKGTFERIFVKPSPKNPIRNLRYAISHDGADQAGNLVIQDGVFEIPISGEFSRRFTLTLETMTAWPHGPNSSMMAADPSSQHTPFDASIFDFSIENAKLLQRRFTIEDTNDSLSEMEKQSESWIGSNRITESATNRRQTWTAVSVERAWPVIRTVPLVPRPNPVAESPIREILAIFKADADSRLNVAYRLGPNVRSLQLARLRGLKIESATFEGTPVDVALSGDTWSFTIPDHEVNSSLIVKYSSDVPLAAIEIPLPPNSTGSNRIPSAIRVIHSPLERLIPPWRSGWHFESNSYQSEFQDVGIEFPKSESSSVTFVSDSPQSQLPIRRVPLLLLILGIFAVSTVWISAVSRLARGLRYEIQSISLIAIAASLASGQIGTIWAVCSGLGILFGALISRFAKGNSESLRPQSSISKLNSTSGADSSPGTSTRSKRGSDEPSTVLKRTGSQEFDRIDPTRDGPSSDHAEERIDEPASWSLALDGTSNRARTGPGTGRNDSAESLS